MLNKTESQLSGAVNKKIGNLQILRIFAASGVVIYHANMNIAGIHTDFFGVALFFMLSGYLMCKLSNRSTLDFVRDRFWRIVPNYWLATIVLCTVFGLWSWWPVEHILLSFLFIPHDSPAGIYPVLGVGWTLNMEMYLYSVFAISIYINRIKAPIIAGLIILTVRFALPYVTDNKAIIYYYTSDYLLYFVIGIAIWYLTLTKSGASTKLPSWTFPISLFAYTIAVVFTSFIFLVPALFLITILASDRKHRLLILMGDSSYACYLLHTILIEFLRTKGFLVSGTIPYTIGVLVASWAIAIAWYISVEKLILILRRSIDNISISSSPSK